MGKPDEPKPGLFFSGLLWTNEDALRAAVDALTERYGSVILKTPDEAFPWADYYEPEMGEGIMRSYAFFDRLLPYDELADAKLAANSLEDEIRRSFNREGRPVNIDPGYLSLENLVLATTKPRPHRVYVGKGVYAESTLGFVNGRHEPWPWTYPDYSRSILAPFFLAARKALKGMLK